MVTLEISTTDIKVMEISGNTIVKWASYSLEPGLFEEEAVTDPQALGAAIRQVMDSNGIRGKKVIASVSSLFSLSRIVPVPVITEHGITEQSVLEKAEEVMPLSEEVMYFFWQNIAPGEGGQQVLITGIPRDILDSEVLTLKSIGLTPRVLDLKTLALARAVNKEQALILNIDKASFDIVIIVGGIPEVLRSTAWQPDEYTQEEKVEHLITSLKLTVDFNDSLHPGFSLDPSTQLFITGQLSGDLTLVEQLTEEVEYSVEPILPPFDYPDHLPVSQYAVNIGLAMKTAATTTSKVRFSLKRKDINQNADKSTSPIPDMNLLPRIYKPWRPSVKQAYSVLAIIVVLGFIFPFYEVTTEEMKKTAGFKTRYNAMNDLLELRKAELKKREPLQKAIDEYNSIVNMRGGFADDLEVIRTLANERSIEMTSISHSGSSISFTCQAPDYIIFRDFLTAIEESGRFSSVSRPSEFFPYPTGGAITIKLSPNRSG
ncbi:pilus assembly protein PilM [Chloroflexota bacterium]